MHSPDRSQVPSSPSAPESLEDARSAAVLHAVSYAAERFLRAGAWLEAANEVLERLGRASDASRVYLFENRVDAEGVLRACHLAEWVAEGIEPQLGSPELEDPAYEGGFGRWAELLSRGRRVEGAVADFPADEQELLKAQGIRSLVVVPVSVHSKWWGFLGFDECFRDRRWSVAEREALTTAAAILGAAIQRDRAEEAVRSREAHYRRLVKMSPYPVFALDMQGRVTEINRAGEKLTGQPAATLLGRPVSDVVLEADRAEVEDVFRELMSGAVETTDFEVRIRTPDGQVRLLQVASSAILDDAPGSDDNGHKLLGVQGIARDVTEERARGVQLRRAERLASLGTLIGGVAHELNNPLTSIRGLAELLLEDTQGDSRREVLATVVREADRTAAIVGDLRMLARQTQHTTRRHEPVDVNDVVRHVLKLRGYAIETHSIDVESELAESLPAVAGDAGELEQVLLNVVVNAEQALEESEGHRRILVRTFGAAEAVVVEVKDNGPGIRPEDMQHLFDPFWTTKDPDQGTGLGLSLAYKIVTEHDGEIGVDSALAVGTTFTIRLPRLAPDVAVSSAEEESDGALRSAAEAEGPQPGLRVLVVDDEASIRQLLRVALSRSGHEVEVADSAAEALERVAEGAEYDLVLSDLRMPDLSGVTLLERLEERDRAFRDRIVFMTGDIYSPEADRLTERGYLLLRKPFRLDDVDDLLRRFRSGA